MEKAQILKSIADLNKFLDREHSGWMQSSSLAGHITSLKRTAHQVNECLVEVMAENHRLQERSPHLNQTIIDQTELLDQRMDEIFDLRKQISKLKEKAPAEKLEIALDALSTIGMLSSAIAEPQEINFKFDEEHGRK